VKKYVMNKRNLPDGIWTTDGTFGNTEKKHKKYIALIYNLGRQRAHLHTTNCK
jgi:hypothetical protein